MYLKENLQTTCRSFVLLKNHHTFLTEVSTGCIDEIENGKVA